jgi:hypothetical protein
MDFSYLAAQVADGAKQPIQPGESLLSIAIRSVIESNSATITSNPNYNALVADKEAQITDNLDGKIG